MSAQPEDTRTILLIEDDALTASLLEYLFTRQGYAVQLAKDGLEAQALLQSGSVPEIVLLDLILPYMDGYELLQMMRQSPAWKQVPVLVISGKSQEEDIVRAFDLGASDYVVKPFRPNELMARVNHLTQKEAQ